MGMIRIFRKELTVEQKQMKIGTRGPSGHIRKLRFMSV